LLFVCLAEKRSDGGEEGFLYFNYAYHY
jgi:hypothetical protein